MCQTDLSVDKSNISQHVAHQPPTNKSYRLTSYTMARITNVIAIFFAFFGMAAAFAPVNTNFGVTRMTPTSPMSDFQPASLQRQRNSVAQVQTMGLFGLGAPEIGVIFVAAAFLLGPEKLASLGKDAGKIAGELKEVPAEFQKGLEEGEAQAKAAKAKLEAEEKASE